MSFVSNYRRVIFSCIVYTYHGVCNDSTDSWTNGFLLYWAVTVLSSYFVLSSFDEVAVAPATST